MRKERNTRYIFKENRKKNKVMRKKTQLKFLYEVDATHLKMADRNRRILDSVVIFTLELALIVVLAIFLDYLALPLFILILYFFPSPLILAPDKYKLTNEGVLFDGHNVFPLKSTYELRINFSRKFVSLKSRWKEVLRLYTSESEKVMEILDNLIKNPKNLKSMEKK